MVPPLPDLLSRRLPHPSMVGPYITQRQERQAPVVSHPII
jgi:hypothetical protein